MNKLNLIWIIPLSMVVGFIFFLTIFAISHNEENNCHIEKEFRFLFNKEYLEEKNISLDNFQYVTYMNLESIYYECPNNIQDCFVYEMVEVCD